MEASVFVGAIVMLVLGIPQTAVTQHVDVFAMPYLNENLMLMMLMSGVFAALRVVGAVSLIRNRAWGLALSIVNCCVTLVLMFFLLPAGILDGLFSGTALVLMLVAWLGVNADGSVK